MKKFISMVMAVALCFVLFGCGESAAKGYSKDDFLVYNEDGEVIARPMATKSELSLDDADDGETYKGVAVGDDAITALKKYNLCYGKAAYYDWTMRTLTKDVDLEAKILAGKNLAIVVLFDENLKALDVMKIFDKAYEKGDDIESGLEYKYMLSFVIFDGKIENIQIAEKFESEDNKTEEK